MRQLVYYFLVVAVLCSSCHGQNNFRAGRGGKGYSHQIDTSNTVITHHDTLKNDRKPVHVLLDNFYKKMTKKNNTIGYGYSYADWIVIIGGVVLVLWLAVNGII